jgi:SNF2 family DNA or RNA helicase
MDGGKTFGTSFWAFKANYYRNLMAHVPNAKFPKYVAIPGAELAVKTLIQDSSMHADKNQCLDLPDLVKKIIEVPMGKEQKRLYDEMKKDMITTITNNKGDTKVSISQLAITKSLRMLQILSGHIPVQDEHTNEQTVIKLKDNPRKDALKDILDNLAPAHKVIVWAIFKDNYADIEEVCKSLKIEYVMLTGQTNDKQASMDEFNNNPKIRVLIGNPRAGGIGVNLVASSYSVYYSRGYSLEDDIQSEARNYRSGSEIHKKVTRIDLVCKHTIDELVLSCLASKVQLSDKILKERLNEI